MTVLYTGSTVFSSFVEESGVASIAEELVEDPGVANIVEEPFDNAVHR